MDLLLIRHGQSQADVLNVIEGRADFGLTALGLRQAACMAAWVGGYMPVDRIISSPLLRARQTAEALAAITHAPVDYDDDLMEWDNGAIAGLSRAEADTRYPMPDPKFPHTAVYGQESAIAFRARAEAVLSRLLHERPPDAKLAIVSHGGTISMLLQSFLALPPCAPVTLHTGDTGIHHLRARGAARSILFANRMGHLRGLT